MDAFFLSLFTWLNSAPHLLEIGVMGVTAGQLALRLPASFPGRAWIVNVLHGLFPSPQIFANGALTTVTEIEKIAPLLEELVDILHGIPLAAAPVAETTPPGPAEDTIPPVNASTTPEEKK